MLESAIINHGRDEDVMEEIMRMSKNAMQAMGLAFQQFLGPFATSCVNTFIAHPLSCVLYSVTTLVSIFGKDQQYVQPLVDMCGALGSKTFEILSKENAFTQRPDIVTEFYELVGRGIRRFPRNMLSAPFADTAFQCACSSMYTDLQHRESLHSLFAYMENIALADANEGNQAAFAEDRVRRSHFFERGRHIVIDGPCLVSSLQAFAAQFLMAPGSPVCGDASPRGAQMMQAILHAVVTKPSACVEPVANCCMAVKRLLPQQADGWVQKGLHAMGPHVPNEARGRFHHEIMNAQDSKAAKQAVRGLYRAPKPQ